MKPFDLARAKAGEPLELILNIAEDSFPVRFLGELTDGRVAVERLSSSGVYYAEVYEHKALRMAPKPKRTVFVNVYDEEVEDSAALEAGAFPTEAEALNNAKDSGLKVLATAIPIEIED